MATTSAWAAGSLVEVTLLEPADDLSSPDDRTTERPTLVGGGTTGERDRFLP